MRLPDSQPRDTYTFRLLLGVGGGGGGRQVEANPREKLLFTLGLGVWWGTYFYLGVGGVTRLHCLESNSNVVLEY